MSRPSIFKRALKAVLPARWVQRLRRRRLFLRSLRSLRADAHVEHFGNIHQIVLSKEWAERNMASLMRMTYHDALGQAGQKALLRSREIKLYSQNGDDGLLLYVFSKIGVRSRQAVNLGCGGSSNTANLVINFGWSSLEIDGGADNVACARDFYRQALGDGADRATVKQAWITRENVNDLIRDAGVTDADLIDIDIDGNDYWIWQALDAIQPAAVLIEYNACLGPAKSVTVPYDEQFDVRSQPCKWYHGASLTALTKLGKEKGYALIGCESNGVNAIFVRRDLMAEHFEEVTPAEAYYPHFQRRSDDPRYDFLQTLPYEQV